MTCIAKCRLLYAWSCDLDEDIVLDDMRAQSQDEDQSQEIGK